VAPKRTSAVFHAMTIHLARREDGTFRPFHLSCDTHTTSRLLDE